MNPETSLEVIQRPESVALGTLNASTPAALVDGASKMAKPPSNRVSGFLPSVPGSICTHR